MDTASQLKYTNEFKSLFMNDLQNPSDALVRYFLSDVYSGQKTAAVIEKFRPIVKDSLNQFISETMNDKLKTALGVSDAPDITVASSKAENDEKSVYVEDSEEKKESKICTTEDELEAFFIIKNIVKNIIPFNRLSYKDNERYMSVICDNKVTKWICRFYFNSSKKFITIPCAEEKRKEKRFDINDLYDIENYKDQIIECAMKFSDVK